MKSLKQLLIQQLPEVRTSAVIAIFVIALLGFADATFLTVEHYRGVIPPCSVTEGCETVLTSAYSFVLGVPTSLLGSIYYLIIAVGSFMYLESRHGAGYVARHNSFILKWILLGSVIGFLASLWFVYLQMFVIHAYCVYCIGSAITSTALFIVSVGVLKKAIHDDRAIEVMPN